MTAARTFIFFAIMAVVAAVPDKELRQSLSIELVTVSSGLRVMRHEVSIAQWRLCVEEKACSRMPKSSTLVLQNAFPMTGINWFDVEEFVAWASVRSKLQLRVPTRDEWYAMSDVRLQPVEPLFTDPRMSWAADYGRQKKIDPTLRPSGGFGMSTSGIADVTGNVWEWTVTCASKGFEGENSERCPAYIVAGEHEAAISAFVGDPASGGCAAGVPPAHLGLRLVSDN